jgi:hypothetical protein
MKVIRKFAVQGHAVPLHVYSPVGPFPPEVLAEPWVESGDEHSDSLHVALDEVRFFRCRDCEEVLSVTEIENHICEEEEY